MEVNVADHVQKVMKPNFGASWEEVGPENELEDTYALATMKTLEGTLKEFLLTEVLSRIEPPLDKTNKMTVSQAKTHLSLGIRSLRCALNG